MLFNSNIFLFAFLPVATAGYYLLARFSGSFAAKVWLCVASCVFYSWWNPVFLLLLVGSVAFNYAVSLRLTGHDEGAGTQQSLILAGGVAANLALLAYFKYLFPLMAFFYRLGWSHVDHGSMVLPIGISFFTFTQIGYLVDCREGQLTERGLLNYVLFVTFFPHLVAGPILHHREIMPQFANEATYRFKVENLASGLTLFALGLFKKVVFADTIAPWAEAGFSKLQGIGFIHAWSVAIAYSMQLYFDFSGYSDMAIALGIMFGVKLPLNFNSPYKSTSIIEFWQRWHMTLTRYLTLLLYNPISLWVARRRQRKGLSSGRQAAATLGGFTTMIIFPTFTTMLLAGIWHGAGLQFIVYGALYGVFLSVNHAWRIVYPPRSKQPARTGLSRYWWVVWPVALTYLAVLVAQIFFRADSVGDAMTLLGGMSGVHGAGFPLPVPANNVKFLGPAKDWLLDHHVIALASREAYNAFTRPLGVNLLMGFGLSVITFAFPNVYQIMGSWSPALNKVQPSSWVRWRWQPTLVWAVCAGLLLFGSSLRLDHAARFLYFQF